LIHKNRRPFSTPQRGFWRVVSPIQESEESAPVRRETALSSSSRVRGKGPPATVGEDEDWLRDVANETEIEDGVIWLYGVGEDGVQAFTDFGIENLIELVRMYKERPGIA
jgi:hypothetical protein